MEGYLLLSFKKHKSVFYLAELMLASQCSYVLRSHKCPECKSKEGEGESLRKHVFHVTSDRKNMDLKINVIIVESWRLCILRYFHNFWDLTLLEGYLHKKA